jgi:hypothetical protein
MEQRAGNSRMSRLAEDKIVDIVVIYRRTRKIALSFKRTVGGELVVERSPLFINMEHALKDYYPSKYHPVK